MPENNVIEDELRVNISPLVSAFKKASGIVQNFGTLFSRETSSLTIDISDEHVQELRDMIKEAQNRMQDPKTSSQDMDKWARVLKECRTELEEINRLRSVQPKNDFAVAISNGTKSLRRFAMGLIGVRSAYATIRRLAQQNEALTNATTAMWKAFGTALSPVFEAVANVIKKIVGYLASFIYWVTGVNILEKALRNGEKHAKGIKKALAGFDEINNIGDTSGGGGGGADTGWVDALQDVEIDTSWVDKFNELTGLGDFFKDFIKFVQDPSWATLLKMLGDIANTIILIGTALVILNASNPFGWILLGVGFVALLIKNIDNIKKNFRIMVDTVKKWFTDTVDSMKKKLKNWYDNLSPDIKNALKGLVWVAQGITNAFIRALNWLIRGINKIQFNVPDWVPLIGGKQFGFNIGEIGEVSWVEPFEKGTNYVPADQLAYIHKGEAIIPKRFNDREYFGGGNDETNQLLSNILDIVSNIDLQPTVKVSDIVKGINKQSRMRGVSVV